MGCIVSRENGNGLLDDLDGEQWLFGGEDTLRLVAHCRPDNKDFVFSGRVFVSVLNKSLVWLACLLPRKRKFPPDELWRDNFWPISLNRKSKDFRLQIRHIDILAGG